MNTQTRWGVFYDVNFEGDEQFNIQQLAEKFAKVQTQVSDTKSKYQKIGQNFLILCGSITD